MHEITLRPAAASDREGILGVWRRAVEATHAFLAPADIDALEAAIRGQYLAAVTLTVAERDEVLVGFIGTTAAPENAVSVEMLFVDPTAHGSGVGTALLEDAAEGTSEVLVDVNEENPSGRRFYEAKGFEVLGRSERDGEGRPFPLLHLRRA